MQVCLAALLVWAVHLPLLIYFLSRLGVLKPGWGDLIERMDEAGRQGRRFDQALYALLASIRLAVPMGVFTYATAGITAIGTICGLGFDAMRVMLCDFYTFVLAVLDRFVSPDPDRVRGLMICAGVHGARGGRCPGPQFHQPRR